MIRRKQYPDFIEDEDYDIIEYDDDSIIFRDKGSTRRYETFGDDDDLVYSDDEESMLETEPVTEYESIDFKFITESESDDLPMAELFFLDKHNDSVSKELSSNPDYSDLMERYYQVLQPDKSITSLQIDYANKFKHSIVDNDKPGDFILSESLKARQKIKTVLQTSEFENPYITNIVEAITDFQLKKDLFLKYLLDNHIPLDESQVIRIPVEHSEVFNICYNGIQKLPKHFPYLIASLYYYRPDKGIAKANNWDNFFTLKAPKILSQWLEAKKFCSKLNEEDLKIMIFNATRNTYHILPYVFKIPFKIEKKYDFSYEDTYGGFFYEIDPEETDKNKIRREKSRNKNIKKEIEDLFSTLCELDFLEGTIDNLFLFTYRLTRYVPQNYKFKPIIPKMIWGKGKDYDMKVLIKCVEVFSMCDGKGGSKFKKMKSIFELSGNRPMLKSPKARDGQQLSFPELDTCLTEFKRNITKIKKG